MKLCVFEDEGYKNLFPLTLTRATFELKCGHTTLLEKILRNFGKAQASYFLREYLTPVFRHRVNAEAVNDINVLKTDDFLIVNGRLLLHSGELTFEDEDEVGIYGEALVYARVRKETVKRYLTRGFTGFLGKIKEEVSARELKATMVTYPWDLVNNNPEAVKDDFKAIEKKGILGRFHEQAAVYGGGEEVYVAKDAEVHPFVVLDTTSGPIIIDEGAKVFPFSRVEGPSCIGRNSWVVRANMHSGSAVGPNCRVGGEVEESIIHGYTNKYHAGFIGHSYVGEWVNLGALTTNSDLKNDYGAVEVYINGKLMNTGETKVGCFIGDHTKTGIGSLINTGTVIGTMSNILSSGEPSPKYIPSFCWYFRRRFWRGPSVERALQTAERVMKRRGVTLRSEDVKLFQHLYDMTREEREKLISRGRNE